MTLITENQTSTIHLPKYCTNITKLSNSMSPYRFAIQCTGKWYRQKVVKPEVVESHMCIKERKKNPLKKKD